MTPNTDNEADAHEALAMRDAPPRPDSEGDSIGSSSQKKSSRLTRKISIKRRLINWGIIILVALGVAFVVRTWVFETFYIPSGSMEPTLMIGDRILVDKLSFQLGGHVSTGDIVVFRRPPHESVIPHSIKYLVKRVIGLPGETISSHGGQVYINGKLLHEPFLPKGTITIPGITTQKIPPGHYFVMGDNREDSEDSRFFGPISSSLIVGKVVARIWPLGAFKIF